jgi:hypothetical protein
MPAPKTLHGVSRSGAVHFLTEEDREDARRGAAALEAHRLSGEPAIPLDDLMRELGLED